MNVGRSADSEIYLDNNATTAPLPEVVEAMLQVYRTGPFNPSSAHRAGDRARERLADARKGVASFLRAQPSQIVFTSGATEANHRVLEMLLHGRQKSFRLVTTEIEHSSILEAARKLGDLGISVRKLTVDRRGLIDLDELRAAIQPGSTLVSVQWANNETGVLQPMAAIAEVCRMNAALLHSDAVQAIGKVPVNLEDAPVDFLSLSGHKAHGPLGVGALYVRNPDEFAPLLPGGGQEGGLRPGTENLPACVGLSTALRVRSERFDAVAKRTSRLRDQLESSLQGTGLIERTNGSDAPRLPNTTNITFRDVDGEALLLRLDQAGVQCSQGSACTNRKPEPSYVLRAMGLSEDQAFRSLRFSVSELNSLEEVDRTCRTIEALHTSLAPFHIPTPAI